MNQRDQIPTVEIDEEIPARYALRAWLAKQPDIYEMRGTLHRWDTRAEGGAGALVPLDADTLTDYCADRLNTTKKDRSVLLPSRLAKALLRSKDAGFREVVSVERWPVVRPDGTVTTVTGYDAATRRIVAPWSEVKPVAEAPTEREIAGARAFLVDHLWGSFPFVSRRSDLAATLAMHATPLLRSYLGEQSLAPLVMISASTPGSGKSFLGQVGMGALYGGVELDGAQTGRELTKSVVAALERGTDSRVLSFDNWKTGTAVGGEFMARLITSPRIEGRLIGTGKFVSVPNDMLKIVSGNNIRTMDDMARRTVFIRLAPEADKPETVTHPFDYEEEVHARRGEIIHALLTLIRGWVAAGAERRPVRLGQFSTWASALAGMCDFAGVPGLFEDHAATLDAMDDHAADYGRFLGAIADRLGGLGTWFKASQVTRDGVLQDLIPRTEHHDRTIGHRALGRLTLAPSVGRVYKDPETGEAYTVRRRWDGHNKCFLWSVVTTAAERARKAAKKTAGALRQVAAKVGVVTRAAQKREEERPAYTLPQVQEAAADRKRAARGVRVEKARYTAALDALNALAPQAE